MGKHCKTISARRDFPLKANMFVGWPDTLSEPWRSLITYYIGVTGLTFGWLPYTLKHGLPDET